jgi:hypothetical protein
MPAPPIAAVAAPKSAQRFDPVPNPTFQPVEDAVPKPAPPIVTMTTPKSDLLLVPENVPMPAPQSVPKPVVVPRAAVVEDGKGSSAQPMRPTNSTVLKFVTDYYERSGKNIKPLLADTVKETDVDRSVVNKDSEKRQAEEDKDIETNQGRNTIVAEPEVTSLYSGKFRARTTIRIGFPPSKKLKSVELTEVLLIQATSNGLRILEIDRKSRKVLE